MAKKLTNTAELIAELVSFGEKQLGLQYLDSVYSENQLLELFNVKEPEIFDGEPRNALDEIIPQLTDIAVKSKIIKEEDSLLFETKLMGFVTPSPSVVAAEFDTIAANNSVEKATEYLYSLSYNTNYIRAKDISKNVRWTAPGDMGDLVVTINLSKPEKDNKQIEREKSEAKTNYPKCPLCITNVGFRGSQTKAPRQTLRVIPVVLGGEEWFFQFSPYVYYDNHAIVFSKEHRPMKIDKDSFIRLLDFVEMFPHYFIGSNADLPIVGGSILSHDHFQGGKKMLPMLSRKGRRSFSHSDFPEVKVEILDWYNSVIKLTSGNRESVEELGEIFLTAWQSYSDEEAEILCETSGVPHNTVTPVAEISPCGDYSLYLILRNNRTDSKRPFGIFHPSEEMHNIKKEGIGIIEAMGIFILPGRLYSEINDIVNILTGKEKLDFSSLIDEKNPLSKHLGMIAQLTNDLGTKLSPEDAECAVVKHINNVCINILNTTAVFKNDERGQQSFEEFIFSCGAH